jgi:hypothetical protein
MLRKVGKGVGPHMMGVDANRLVIVATWPEFSTASFSSVKRSRSFDGEACLLFDTSSYLFRPCLLRTNCLQKLLGDCELF